MSTRNSLIRRLKRHSSFAALFRSVDPVGYAPPSPTVRQSAHHGLQRAVLLAHASTLPFGQTVGYPPVSGQNIMQRAFTLPPSYGMVQTKTRVPGEMEIKPDRPLPEHSYADQEALFREGEIMPAELPTRFTGPDNIPTTKTPGASVPGIQLERQDETETQDVDWPRLQKIFNAHQDKIGQEEQHPGQPSPPPSREVGGQKIARQADPSSSPVLTTPFSREASPLEGVQRGDPKDDGPPPAIQQVPLQSSWPVERSRADEFSGADLPPMDEQAVESGDEAGSGIVQRQTVTESASRSSIEIIPLRKPAPKPQEAPSATQEAQTKNEPKAALFQKDAAQTHQEFIKEEPQAQRSAALINRSPDPGDPHDHQTGSFSHLEGQPTAAEPGERGMIPDPIPQTKPGGSEVAPKQAVNKTTTRSEPSKTIFRQPAEVAAVIQRSEPAEEKHTPASQSPLVKTSIGELPADLWQILGKEAPPITHAHPAASRPPEEPGVSQDVLAAERSPVAVEVASEQQATRQPEIRSTLQRQIEPDEQESVLEQPNPPLALADLVDGLDSQAAEISLDELSLRVYEQIRRRLGADWERLRRRI